MAIGSHGTVNYYEDGETRIVIRPKPVLYTLKQVVCAVWELEKEIDFDLDGTETEALGEDSWPSFTEKYNNKTKLVEYLLYYVYEHYIRNPDECPTIEQNLSYIYQHIPEDDKTRIVNYVLKHMPSLRGDSHPHKQ